MKETILLRIKESQKSYYWNKGFDILKGQLLCPNQNKRTDYNINGYVEKVNAHSLSLYRGFIKPYLSYIGSIFKRNLNISAPITLQFLNKLGYQSYPLK